MACSHVQQAKTSSSSSFKYSKKHDHFPSKTISLKHEKYVLKVGEILRNDNSDLRASVRMIDSLQQLGIDYHYKDEIEVILSSVYEQFLRKNPMKNDLFYVALSFRLLRQAGYPISAEVLGRFLDSDGHFNLSLSKDIEGMLSLYEASHLSTHGEHLLHEANVFSTKHLQKAAEFLDHQSASQVKHTLENPYHLNVQRFRVRYHLDHDCYRRSTPWNEAFQELAKLDFNIIQSLNRREAAEILRWWKDLGLAEELKLARDQPLKWFMWPMNIIPYPEFSKCRMDLAKIISFVYIMDDIFDVYGTLDELNLFTEAVNKWELSAVNSLPCYMRKCYECLYNTTKDVAENVLKQHGWNPINSFKKAWIELCEAFLREAKWYSSGQVPNVDEYMESARVSCGVHIVLVHLFFLLGEEITKENAEKIDSHPMIISYPATILRLWDDLGSAKDENQNGYDGSYLECYKKEHPCSSSTEARDQVKRMISNAWQGLNNELINSRRNISQNFLTASLNTARMVRVMYAYEEDQSLPLLDDHIRLLLSENVR